MIVGKRQLREHIAIWGGVMQPLNFRGILLHKDVGAQYLYLKYRPSKACFDPSPKELTACLLTVGLGRCVFFPFPVELYISNIAGWNPR